MRLFRRRFDRLRYLVSALFGFADCEKSGLAVMTTVWISSGETPDTL
jgi:hypothetical protein